MESSHSLSPPRWFIPKTSSSSSSIHLPNFGLLPASPCLHVIPSSCLLPPCDRGDPGVAPGGSRWGSPPGSRLTRGVKSRACPDTGRADSSQIVRLYKPYQARNHTHSKVTPWDAEGRVSNRCPHPMETLSIRGGGLLQHPPPPSSQPSDVFRMHGVGG